MADPEGFSRVAGDSATTTSLAVEASADAVALARLVATEPNTELERLLAIRIADLIDYQNSGYAKTYVDFVEAVRQIETIRTPGGTPITEGVARNLYKLMAYKDEYEVARLARDPRTRSEVDRRFGRGATVVHHLHPPILRSLGMKRKLKIRRSSKIVFGVLHSMRRTRGSRLDLFGYSKIRRLERALIMEYREAIVAAMGSLRPETGELVTRIAELPDEVRGYETIKLRNVASYRDHLAGLMDELAQASAQLANA